MVDVGTLHLRYPMFRDQVEPKGRLVIDKKCHACWYYYMLADKCRVTVGTGIDSQIIEYDENETPPDWMDKHYHNIARTVALLYQLDSPEDFLPYFPLVQKEAERLGYAVEFEIVRPFGVGKIQ